jgi:hypothetical protein
MDEGMDIPTSIKDYLEKGPFKVYTTFNYHVLNFRSSTLQALMKSHSLASMAQRRNLLVKA